MIISVSNNGYNTINKQVDGIIWLCFALWVLVDSFNGFALSSHLDLRISRFFKFIVFAIVAMRLIRVNSIKLVFLILFPYTFLVLYNSYELNGSVTETFALLMKPLSSFVFFLYFKYIATKDGVIFEKNFWKVFIWSFFFFAANIILGLLGFGNFVYNTGDDNSFGVKGFIYAQNEISGLVIYLYPMTLYYVRIHYSRLVYYLLCAFIVVISFSVGTKMCLGVALLSVVVVTYYLSVQIERKMIVAMSIFAVILGITYLSYLIAMRLDIVERFMYFYGKYGIMHAITSGRLDNFENCFTDFFRMDFADRILGWGGRVTICEMDPFDAVLSFGYIGGFINILFLIYLFAVPRFWHRKDDYKKIMVFCNTVLLFAAIFSGHIFFSSMAGLFVVLANARLYAKKN